MAPKVSNSARARSLTNLRDSRSPYAAVRAASSQRMPLDALHMAAASPTASPSPRPPVEPEVIDRSWTAMSWRASGGKVVASDAISRSTWARVATRPYSETAAPSAGTKASMAKNATPAASSGTLSALT